MLRALLVLCLVCVASPVLAQGYQSKELADAARDRRQELIDSIPVNKKQLDLIAGLRRTAEADFQAKRYTAAIDELTRAIVNGADDGLIWLRLAQSELAAADDRAMASAYNAYLRSTDLVERDAALFVIGREYDRHDKQKEALAAFDPGLGFTRLPASAEGQKSCAGSPPFASPRSRLRPRRIGGAPASGSTRQLGRKSAPRATFPEALLRAASRASKASLRRAATHCASTASSMAGSRTSRFSPGSRGPTSEHLRETFATQVVIPDRKPQIRFSGTGYLLPKEGTSGLPLTTVNVDKVTLRLLRVNDRNLIPSIDAERLTTSFSPYEVDEVINRTDSLVWQGEMAIIGERNRPVATAIPLKDILREKGTSVYLVVAQRSDLKDGDFEQPATNWVLVSNLGLAAYEGADGLAVDVRSLADGRPLSGIAIRLYARNNGELAAARSDADGIAHISGGLLRGRGGDEPFVVTAHGPDGDFNFLEIGRAAFELSDRGA